ncbi:MAG: BlaI/MecI/CopY family transcriptional regulator, partial [Verrucomicrobia bacterium]|nr:BlaI/MecI/CopY family transcriptional regulator [Cytophagales bacterium]
LQKGLVVEVDGGYHNNAEQKEYDEQRTTILEQKGFVGHQAFGKSHQYFASVSKNDYKKFATDKLLDGYFENSVADLVSFFAEKKQINLNQANEILELIQKMKKEN